MNTPSFTLTLACPHLTHPFFFFPALPAYPVGLFFAYSLTPAAPLYWPGATWFFASLFLLAAIFVQLFAHGAPALVLKKRLLKVIADPELASDTVVVNPLLPDTSAGEQVSLEEPHLATITKPVDPQLTLI